MTLTITLRDGDHQRICHRHQWASIPSVSTPPPCPRCHDETDLKRYFDAVGSASVAPYEPERIIEAQRVTIQDLQKTILRWTRNEEE